MVERWHLMEKVLTRNLDKTKFTCDGQESVLIMTQLEML